MRRLRIAMAGLLGFLAFAPAQATVTDSDGRGYEGIVSRNVFGLKPIPKEAPPQAPQRALPKIIVNGITSIVEPKRVLLKLQTPARPPEPPVEQLLILSEGQRDGVVEVLQIDVKQGTVRLINSGTEMLLSIEKDGPNAANAPAASGAAQAPPALGRTAVYRPAVPNVAARHGAERNPNAPVAGAPNSQPAAIDAPPLPTVPAAATATAEPLTPEQEAILAEVERQASRK